MAKRRVLLVVEGERKEVELFSKLFKEYELDLDYEIYSYCANVHDLYERMFSDGDPNDLSLMGVLREWASDEDKQLFNQDYSDVLLVFDYDPQDNRFSPERLEVMQDYFNESTDEGKLYINYPMVEACKHFCALPDHGYLGRSVNLSNVRDYKSIVDREGAFKSITHDVGRYELDQMVAFVAVKACRIVEPDVDPKQVAEMCHDVDHRDILARQNGLYMQRGEVAVLGTCLLFIVDYSSELADLKWILKELFGR